MKEKNSSVSKGHLNVHRYCRIGGCYKEIPTTSFCCVALNLDTLFQGVFPTLSWKGLTSFLKIQLSFEMYRHLPGVSP